MVHHLILEQMKVTRSPIPPKACKEDIKLVTAEALLKPGDSVPARKEAKKNPNYAICEQSN